MNLRHLAVLSLAVLVLLAACGTEGPAGPAGRGIDASKAYCNTSHAGNVTESANTWTTTQICSYAGDIPLSGDCYLLAAPGVSEFFYLSNSSPVAWGNTLVAPGWTCAWSPGTGAPTGIAPGDFPGRAEMCCISSL